jgi:hypothetical protein
MFKSNFRPEIFSGLISLVVIFISGCPDVTEIEKENIERVKRIDASTVKQIEIYADIAHYKNQHRKLQKTLVNSNDIENFTHSLKSLRGIRPNHPQYPNKWHIKIVFKDLEEEELKIMQRIGDKKYLYVRCLGDSWFGSAADAISADMYRWMDRNIGLPNLE